MPALIDGIAFGGLIADEAFDSDALVADLGERAARVVTSQYATRSQKLKIDCDFCTQRHLIENLFCKIKAFKRFAMRACKADGSYEG